MLKKPYIHYIAVKSTVIARISDIPEFRSLLGFFTFCSITLRCVTTYFNDVKVPKNSQESM